MKVENQMHPQSEQLQRILQTEGAVCMVNLLKFRETAAYPDGRDPELSGREAYMRYANAMSKLIEGAGGSLLFEGVVLGGLIGEIEENWDVIAIARYPSAKALAEISSTEAFEQIQIHREAGLAGQLLIPTHSADDGR